MLVRTILALALVGSAFAGGAARAEETGCDYDVRVTDRQGIKVAADVTCVGEVGGFVAHPGVVPYVTRFEDAGGRALTRDESSWLMPDSPKRSSVHYEVDLGAFAASGARGVAAAGRSFMPLAQTWLFRPAPVDLPLRIRIINESDQGVATGFASADGVIRLTARQLAFAGYTAFGTFDRRRIEMAGTDGAPAAIDLVQLDGRTALGPDRIATWVGRAGEAMARYFNGYPAERSLVVILPMPGRDSVPFGRVIPGGGITMMVQVGEQADRTALLNDWVLVHEMVHTAMPFLSDNGSWLMEGLATYVEPIVRARAGWIAPEAVWAEFARGMPRGIEAMTRLGMRRAGFGAIYWGGALFALITDIEMRQRTDGQRGIEDCLRAVRRDGGTGDRRWTTAEFIAACDRAIGGNTMAENAETYYLNGGPVDLDRLWADLGVVQQGERFVTRADAPLARIREAIIWGRPGIPKPAPIPFD
ncbi:hypothetical protein [Desertibaculum subflavum]|uniref:hypothetical protein n=1 Tax=Desertibaculum subflavum TaxID=2268458 RepID=UPI000E66FE10